jgi:histidine triad (HIT) family protein
VSDAAAECLFCAIVAGAVPARIVASSDAAVAFEDIAPGAPVHVLVVPRTHIGDARDIDGSSGAVLSSLFELANTVAAEQGISEQGYRLVVNVGPDAGQSVAHLHLHLLGGRRLEWPPG